MNFTSIQDLKNEGFAGFVTVSGLLADSSIIPSLKGVYLVLYLEKEPVQFVAIGTGGHFKGQNPNVPVSFLQEKWIKGTIVVYIGKAGKEGGSATLKSRLRQYLRFGQGNNIGHWGGRLIWQIKNHGELVICWKTLKNEDPRSYESALLKEFVPRYNKRPFANLSN